MMQSFHLRSTNRARSRRTGLLATTCAGVSLLAGALHAGPIPQNLGSGLDALVESNVKLKAAQKSGQTSSMQLHNGYATEKAAKISENTITDSEGRIMVRLHPTGLKPIGDIKTAALAAVPNFKVTAMDTTYHGAGVIEGFAAIDDVPKLAGLDGVSAVRMTPKPVHARLRQPLDPSKIAATPGMPNATVGEKLTLVGTVYDFGITQHRVDQINKLYNPNATLDYEGRNISVGVMSDSFDTGAAIYGGPDAADDVASGDLPGKGNSINGQPIAVLQDFPDGTDEGRAMCQTVFKMAPKARLAFATADEGEVGFADNILALAGFSTFTYPAATQQGFKADVIVDDVSYLDEPFFQDGIIAQAVDKVANIGVSYFSSAANNLGTNGYDAPFRFVPNGTGLTAAAGNNALKGTNINLANVPPALYAGGFQNFAESGLDVAQQVDFPDADTLGEYGLGSIPVILQWNDPDDTTTPTLGQQVFSNTGTIVYNSSTGNSSTVSFKLALAEKQEYFIQEQPSSSPATSGLFPLDGIVIITDANGNELSYTDNNSAGSPESVLFFPPTTGEYTVTIKGFEAPSEGYTTDGSFTLTATKATGQDHITQDLNLLVFDMEGNYLPDVSATSNNIASNSPIEFASVVASGTENQVQFVISRSNAQPTSGRVADHMRYLCFGDGITSLGPAEHFAYLTPVTFGHSAASGANSVAAYPFYKPNLPEFYTSPGPVTIYFDYQNNPLSTPLVREKPDIAAMDGANTTFFGGDASEDTDTAGNFFGTSDAAPHAAAIAALVLEANGGSGKVLPAKMKNILRASTFPHDLDPFASYGTAKTSDGGTVTVQLNSDNESTAIPHTTGTQDPNSFKITYTGPGSLATFVFNPSGSPATSGNKTGGQNGIIPAGTYFQQNTPGFLFGPGKPFTLGTASTGLDGTTITSTASNLATTPANAVSAGRYFTETLSFTPGAFTTGKFMHFTIGRYEYRSADVTTMGGTSVSDRTGDLLGGGVSIPDGTIYPNGMSFSGTTTAGGTFTGFMKNSIGAGYSPVDGYGFINAQAAVTK